MARDISLAISVRDNFSTAITTMKNANNSFKKDVTELQNKLDLLNKNKITLKVETEKANAALREAKKAFKELGDTAGEEHVKELQKANDAYEQARRNLNLVSTQARNTEKDIINLTGAISKAETRAGAGGPGGSGGLLSTLGEAGMYKFLGGAAANIAGGLAASAFGMEGSTMFSNILSNATSGAAIGSLVPGLGSAVGTAIGAGVGLVNAVVDIEKNKDEAFKNVVKTRFEEAMQSQMETQERGITIAGSREMKKISFTTLLGSEDAADEYLAEMLKFAETTPFGYDQLADLSKTLLAYGYKVDELIPLLTKVGDAGSALSLNAEDINSIATYLGRMQITGQTTSRYLTPLLDKGIPVWDYLAKASGKTKEEVQEMVSKGLVPGAEAAKAIADYMGADFAGNMEKQSKTYEGIVSILGDIQESFDAAMGEGYTEERKKGIQAQIDYFEGESGEKIKEAHKMIGEWKASLDNEREAYLRESMNEMMDDDEYIQAAAEGNRVKMGELLAEAQAKGENRYNAGEGAQNRLKMEEDLAKRISEDTVLENEYWNAGHVMGKAFSKGRAAAASSEDFSPSYWGGSPSKTIKGYAYGLSYVPYDNFPALLHQGERVLTANENRSSRSIPQVNITGNNFNVRSEDDIEKIGDAIIKRILNTYEVM